MMHSNDIGNDIGYGKPMTTAQMLIVLLIIYIYRVEVSKRKLVGIKI